MNLTRVRKDWKTNKIVYLMVLPVIVYFAVFCYAPMAGVALAFERYSLKGGIFGSQWVGLQNFFDFFNSYYFGRLLKNTFLLSFYDLIFYFPAPIVFALLMNELVSKRFKKVVQTVSYMPYFVSMVVVAGIIIEFCSSTGAITGIVKALGGPDGNLLGMPRFFRSIFIGSNMWQFLGSSSIIIIAAITGIDQELYEAADLDGIGRFRKMIYITLPSISSTLLVLLILRLGFLFSVNFEKIILLYSPSTYSVSDVISSFTYRKGLLQFDYGYSTAVGLFNSLLNFITLVIANMLSRKYAETSLF